MGSCRVMWKGSGVVFGQPPLHVDNRHPKTTPDPAVRNAKGSGVVFGKMVFQVASRWPKTTPDPVRVLVKRSFAALQPMPGEANFWFWGDPS
jgi:hypothetical protein